MAEISRTGDGRWKATVVLPIKLASGRSKRRSKTFDRRGQAEVWATKLEAEVDAGTWRGSARRSMTLREFREEWRASRISVTATLKKNDSLWRNHLEPVWGGHPLDRITRPELKVWVHRIATLQCAVCLAYPPLTAAGVLGRHRSPTGTLCAGSGRDPGLGGWTIQGAAAHLSGLLSTAVEDELIPANPALRLRLPTVAPKPPFYWTEPEAEKIYAELTGADQLAIEINMRIGLRPGELFGLRRRYVRPDAGLAQVYGVATRDGWRPHGKTTKSHRAVPIPPWLRPRLAEHLEHLGDDDLVFPAPDGGVWDDRNFAQRVFLPAVKAAGVRRGTPYDTRHTAASWLVQGGVDLLEVQDLLGHEKYSTTLRYAHLRPGAFSSVLGAWGTGS